MASIKITQGVRHAVIEGLDNLAFNAREQDAYSHIGVLCYERLMTPMRSSLPPSMLKDKWIGTSTSVNLSQYEHKDFARSVDYDYFRIPCEVPVHVDEHLEVRIALDDDFDELTLAHREWKRVRQARCEFCNEVRAIVSSVTTTKALMEVLPEAAQFIPGEMHGGPLVDMKLVESVRAQLGHKETA